MVGLHLKVDPMGVENLDVLFEEYKHFLDYFFAEKLQKSHQRAEHTELAENRVHPKNFVARGNLNSLVHIRLEWLQELCRKVFIVLGHFVEQFVEIFVDLVDFFFQFI